MMNKKFLFAFVKKVTFLGVMGFLWLTSPEAFAESGDLFQNAFTTIYHTFTQARVVVYVTAGFGLIGVAVAAISGKLPWRWLAMISVALFTLAAAEKIVMYATSEDLGNTPESDFSSEVGDSDFKIYTGGSDSFNYNDFSQNAVDTTFENQ